MNREGIVINEAGKNVVEVSILKHTACGDCGACSYGKENLNATVMADNKIGAKPGDKVELDLQDQNVLSAAFIAYVIPLITLVASISILNKVLGMFIASNVELIAALIGIALTAVVYVVIKSYDQKFADSKRFFPKVTRVIQHSVVKEIL